MHGNFAQWNFEVLEKKRTLLIWRGLGEKRVDLGARWQMLEEDDLHHGSASVCDLRLRGRL